MKTIVFFCIPAHGHTNPTLGVVRELVSRGHRIIYYSYEIFRDKIEAASAEFIPCDDYNMEQTLSPGDAARLGSDLAFSTKILVDTTLALDEKVCQDMMILQPDCIVADSMAVWGKAVAMKLGIPFVSSTTTFAFNQHSAKVMPQQSKDLLKMILGMIRANRHVRRLKNRGYPVKNVLDIISNDSHTHTIVYTSPEFQPCADTFDPEYYCFVGPSLRPSAQEWQKTKDILVYISMGTVNNDLLPLYRSCIDALGKTPWQIVLSVGNQVDTDAFGRLPENVSVYTHVDQIAVLQKADVFLTHCGMNSVSEALWYGVPLVLNPKTSEQQGVAHQAASLGAGIHLKEETPETILEAIRNVLETPAFRKQAQCISDSFHSCPGASGAADKILSVCK